MLAMQWIRPAIIVVLLAIIASLGVALYHLATGRGDSTKLVNSLTLRIVLSVVLFLLLMLAWRFGLIQPHGLHQ
jgi:hypothetical protein